MIDDIVEDMVSSLLFYCKYGHENYCPECRKAKLKYSSSSDRGKRRSFLSVTCIEDHEEKCSYKHKYVNQSEAKEIADNRLCVNTLERIVNRMMLNDIFKSDKVKNDNGDDSVTIHNIQKNNKIVKRKIFKKSINNISLDDKDFYYYYGKTKIVFLNDYYKNIIRVQISNKQPHFFNINLVNRLNIELSEDKVYCISFFGNVCEKISKGIKYPEINLINNSCIFIKEYNNFKN